MCTEKLLGIVCALLLYYGVLASLPNKLHQAAFSDTVDNVRALVEEQHYNIHERTHLHLQTPLHYAAHGLNADVFEYLYEKGACLKVCDSKNQTLLHHLVLGYIKRRDAILPQIDEGAQELCLKIINILLLKLSLCTHNDHKQLYIDDIDIYGNTALHYAAGGSDCFLYLLLRDHGASQHRVNNIGQTPKDVLVANKNDYEWRLKNIKKILEDS